MDGTWQAFLEDSAAADHAAQIYRDVGELADSVATYLSAGFESGEPAVAVAAPDHWGRISERLEARGWGPLRIEQEGLLTLADAEATLDRCLLDGAPSARLFEEVIGGLLDGVAVRFPGRRIRAFGEMVNLLSESGRPDEAVALEALWNDLARTRSFSLLCGYRLDLFDRVAQVSPLPEICRLHSHVRPAADTERLHRAVDAALEETLGPLAGKVYALVAPQLQQTRTPVAQLALMWVSANMPAVADRVLASARTHYLAEPAASPS
jgi:hypothetical protein